MSNVERRLSRARHSPIERLDMHTDKYRLTRLSICFDSLHFGMPERNGIRVLQNIRLTVHATFDEIIVVRHMLVLRPPTLSIWMWGLNPPAYSARQD